MKVKCHRCGKEFERSAKQVKTTRKLSCSKECKGERVSAICATCGRAFTLPRSRFERRGRNRCFCNKQCTRRGNDLTGQTFGSLEVVKEAVQIGWHRRWLCRCTCGNLVEVNSGNLRKGTKQCEQCAWNGHKKKPYEWLYNRFLRCAKAAGWDTDITFSDFLEFTKVAICHYCEKPVTWTVHASEHGKRVNSGYNLDRKNANSGYLKSNVVVCCTICNYSKGDRFTYEQWLKVAEVLKTFA